MRASMAIPGVFSAVQIDSMMLVDGGVIRNLPVQEAIDMGADIVIAVYVGFEKNVTPEDLFSLSEVLTRTTIFLGVIDSKQQMKLADILISPDMTGVSATSFSNSDTIVARGERAARRVKDRLQHLADSLNLTFQPVEKLSGPPFIYVSDVEVENLRYVNESFVIGQGNIFPGTYTNKSQIEKAVERIYGTRYFRKVGYRLEHLSGMKYRLIYMTKEGSRASVKIAPHYSNQLGTGITLNTTLRNYLIPSSRIKFTANVAESPGIKFDLNKYFGKEQKMIGHQFVYWNQAKLPVFFEGENVGNYKHSLFQTGIGSKYSISFNQQVGFDFFYERSMVKPGGAVENFYPQADFDNYAAGGFAYRAYFHFNSLNDKYFATKGTKFDITLKRVMKPLSTYKIEGDQSLDEEIFNLDVKPFNTFQLNVDQYVPIGNNFSINTGTGIGLSSTQAPITNHFALGGLLYSEKYKYETFYGLHFGEQIIANFWKVSTVLNYQITSRIFFTAAGNVAVTGDELDVFLSSIGAWKSSDYLKGFATGLRFNTFIGPLVLMVGDNDLDGNPRWYVSFGYKF
jgi:NTE family protein